MAARPRTWDTQAPQVAGWPVCLYPPFGCLTFRCLDGDKATYTDTAGRTYVAAFQEDCLVVRPVRDS